MANPSLGEPIPRGTLPALVDSRPATALPSGAGPRQWRDLASAGWDLAFLPILLWSSVMTASWSAWHDRLQPGADH